MKKEPVVFTDSLMSAAGIEPATNGLKGHCSAIELRAPCGADFIM